ncbi:ArsR family transcriptional regulator [Arthrobacter sp. EpRS66]|nr:ArsR family transcriptional regulator [Arthrobacter sp. EpRS66]
MTEIELEKVGSDALSKVQATIPEWIEVFSLCADETRIKLLIAMHAAPGSSVSQLAEATGLSPNTVTQALATLHRAQVVQVERDGKYRRWQLVHPGIHQLLHQLQAPHSILHPEH